MEDNNNPYAAPKAAVVNDKIEYALYRVEGNKLFIPNGADLPARCVKCNAPVITAVKKRKLYWHSPSKLIKLVCIVKVVAKIF